MSKARPQSASKRAQRIMLGLQNPNSNASKRPGMRAQVIHLSQFEKKKGRKSNFQKRIEALKPGTVAVSCTIKPKTKIIYHKI